MSRACRILIVLAAIMGADGVMLAAASAHGADASRLAVRLVDAAVSCQRGAGRRRVGGARDRAGTQSASWRPSAS
jgi:hypothetical protein